MKIKNYSQFLKEEKGWKDILIGGLMGASMISSSPVMSQSSQVPSTSITQVKYKILSRVEGPIGIQSVTNPHLDLVHGILGSKRLVDNFEKRVSDELAKLNKEGYKTDVSNIQIKTYIKGGKIFTESSCDIVESEDENSYSIFTTRGSIGDNFEERHDKQVEGLEDRIKSTYGGNAKKVKTFTISFLLNGQNISYKQSFFVASRNMEIVGSDLNDLRDKLKSITLNQSIDLSSVKVDIDNMKVSYKIGNTKVTNLSIVFDDRNDLDRRLDNIKLKNKDMRVLDKGNYNKYQWALLAII